MLNIRFDHIFQFEYSLFCMNLYCRHHEMPINSRVKTRMRKCASQHDPHGAERPSTSSFLPDIAISFFSSLYGKTLLIIIIHPNRSYLLLIGCYFLAQKDLVLHHSKRRALSAGMLLVVVNPFIILWEGFYPCIFRLPVGSFMRAYRDSERGF